MFFFNIFVIVRVVIFILILIMIGIVMKVFFIPLFGFVSMMVVVVR